MQQQTFNSELFIFAFMKSISRQKLSYAALLPPVMTNAFMF